MKNREELSKRLVYLADISDSEDVALVKGVKREYKAISNQLYPPTKESASKVKESRLKALKQIEEYLQATDVESQFENIGEKKIVVWIGNVNGFPKERIF